jgi:hypothetical protein
MPSISEEVKKFLEHKLADGFGCDINTVVEACKGSGRFAHWLGSNPTSVKSLLETVRSTGMSPELFAAKEIQEGYNASWGWHNHTVPQGDPTQDAIYVVNHTKEVANSTGGQPAWDDPGGGTVGVVPIDVQEAGNAHYASLAQGTIGRAYVAMTAAATWSMYYPEALKASVNGVQDYGNPLQGCIDLIKSWGGTIGGSSGSNNGGGVSPQQPPTNNTSTKNKSGGLYYIINNTLWNIQGSGNSSESNSSESSSRLSTNSYTESTNLYNISSNRSRSIYNSFTNFSSEEDQKLWEETENDNPSGGDGLTDHTKHVRAFIMKKFGLKEAHGVRADDDGTGHGHNSGMAVDFMIGYGLERDQTKGQQIADYMIENFYALGIYYLIWEQKFYMNQQNIYGPEHTWNSMPDRGSPTQNHMDHIHVSFVR